MWWSEIPSISYTNFDGKKYAVKLRRDIPTYDDFVNLEISGDEKIDEIASRNNVYGQFMETNSYAIFEANIIKLTENNFDLSKIRSLMIPVVE